jgi:hypothetical protein
MGLQPFPPIEPMEETAEDRDEEAALGEVEEDESNRVHFADYQPRKLTIGRRHPDEVIESATLGAVDPPDIDRGEGWGALQENPSEPSPVDVRRSIIKGVLYYQLWYSDSDSCVTTSRVPLRTWENGGKWGEMKVKISFTIHAKI